MKPLLLALVVAGCDDDSASPATADTAEMLRGHPGDWYSGTAGVSMVVGVIDSLTRVDGASQVCADGSVEQTCAIDDFDVAPAHLDPAEPVPSPFDGTVLYRGGRDTGGGTDVLRAAQVWGQGIDPSRQSDLALQPDVALVHATGAACVDDPCEVYDERVLSVGGGGGLAELDFSVSGAKDAEIDAALAAAGQPDGLVVEGPTYDVSGPAGDASGRTVFRFWIRVPTGP